MKKPKAIVSVILILVLLVVAACSKGGNNPGSNNGDTKTIVLSTITNYYTAGLEQAAADYNKLNPQTKVKIEIVSDNTTYMTSFQAKMSAGGAEAPDIIHANLIGDSPVNNVSKGFIYPLNDFVKQPNPYNKDVSIWDGVNEDYWPYAYTAAGDIFMVPFDLVGTGFFYNKDLFEANGITEPPTTWEDLFDVLEKLKNSGVIPVAMSQATGSDYEGWMVGAFMDWAARDLIPDIIVQAGDARNTPEVEEINSKVKYDINNPFFDIGAVVDNERLMALWKSGKYDNQGAAEQKYWSTLKKLSTYLQPGYATMSDADAYQLFISGKAATYWNGSWQVGQILKDQQALGDKGFAWGTFKFPNFKEADPNFPGDPRGILVPGHQMAIANKKDEDLRERALDFLMFLYSAEQAQKVFTTTIDAGQFVQGPSLVKGVELPEEVNAYLAGFEVAGNMNGSLGVLANGNPAAEPNATAELKELQLQYYNDKLTLEQFLQQKAAFAKKTNEKYITENNYDLDPTTNP